MFQQEKYAERIKMVRKIRNVQTFEQNTGTERHSGTFVKTGWEGRLRIVCKHKEDNDVGLGQDIQD